ncbi:acyltransferase [Maribacter dokdonensis]|uniref:acyltransferase n=1 Tax=Maribacter dokdonensis TaxID=320912 RepID=UPI002AAFD140|nr:acyltransferase [Maribacter dokdonensis]
MIELLFFLPSKTINHIKNWITLKRKSAVYESYPEINGSIFMTGRGNLILGKNIKLNSSRSSNPIGGDVKLIIDLGKNGNLSIGDNTGISNSAIIAHNNIFIGKNVKIGGSVKMYDTDFHSLDFQKRKDKKIDVAQTKGITIKDNVFIGAHSIILKGVTIGENSIIGAGSVVAKSIPTNQIWAGNPAKFIKELKY